MVLQRRHNEQFCREVLRELLTKMSLATLLKNIFVVFYGTYMYEKLWFRNLPFRYRWKNLDIEVPPLRDKLLPVPKIFDYPESLTCPPRDKVNRLSFGGMENGNALRV